MEYERFLGEKRMWLRYFVPFSFPARLKTGTYSSLKKIIAEYTEYWMLWIRKVLCAKWPRHLQTGYLVIGFLEKIRCLDRKSMSRMSPWLFQVHTHVALLMSLLFFNSIISISSVWRACLAPYWYSLHQGIVICLLIWRTYACVACERIWGDVAVPS